MTYGEFKSFVLQLIDQYSVHGSELPVDYNDQSDYIIRIPGLYNAAMTEMCSGAAPLVAVMQPDDADIECGKGVVAVKVPSDFMRMSGDGIPVVRGGQMTREKGYYMAGADTVMIRKDLFKDGILEYYRYPARLGMTPSDKEELDGTIEMQTAAAYYTAGMLVLQSDAFAYASLRNEYDDKLSAMKKRQYAEIFHVADVMNINFDPY